MSTAPLEYILSLTYNTSGLPEWSSISHRQITITDQTTEQIIVSFRGGRVRAPKTAMSACVRERKSQYSITETAVTNGKKVAVLKTMIPLLNRSNMFMSVFPNQGASMLRVR